ncbi:hypothetical protein LZ32DRAFT_623156 [Colletotrichum eremochloae]|nr:hypothetical protein LZ32DRAFT_623156 [Colletotrichum eremochloae]
MTRPVSRNHLRALSRDNQLCDETGRTRQRSGRNVDVRLTNGNPLVCFPWLCYRADITHITFSVQHAITDGPFDRFFETHRDVVEYVILEIRIPLSHHQKRFRNTPHQAEQKFAVPGSTPEPGSFSSLGPGIRKMARESLSSVKHRTNWQKCFKGRETMKRWRRCPNSRHNDALHMQLNDLTFWVDDVPKARCPYNPLELVPLIEILKIDWAAGEPRQQPGARDLFATPSKPETPSRGMGKFIFDPFAQINADAKRPDTPSRSTSDSTVDDDDPFCVNGLHEAPPNDSKRSGR